jgi:hypothetical protein
MNAPLQVDPWGNAIALARRWAESPRIGDGAYRRRRRRVVDALQQQRSVLRAAEELRIQPNAISHMASRDDRGRLAPLVALCRASDDAAGLKQQRPIRGPDGRFRGW